MLSCKEVVAQGDLLLAGELGVYGKFRMYLHLAMCVYCRLYMRQLKLLVQSLRYLSNNAGAVQVQEVIQAARPDGDAQP